MTVLSLFSNNLLTIWNRDQTVGANLELIVSWGSRLASPASSLTSTPYVSGIASTSKKIAGRRADRKQLMSHVRFFPLVMSGLDLSIIPNAHPLNLFPIFFHYKMGENSN